MPGMTMLIDLRCIVHPKSGVRGFYIFLGRVNLGRDMKKVKRNNLAIMGQNTDRERMVCVRGLSPRQQKNPLSETQGRSDPKDP